MAKLRAVPNNSGKLNFKCPACKVTHGLNVDESKNPCWEFNGSMDFPTFKPSLKVTWGPNVDRICHSHIYNGKIQFLGDCTHELAGTTVDIPEWSD